VGGKGEGTVAVGGVKHHRLAPQTLEARGAPLSVAVKRQMIGPESIDGDEDNGGAWIWADGRGATARDATSQEGQDRKEKAGGGGTPRN
jgi:hypothetical protein